MNILPIAEEVDLIVIEEKSDNDEFLPEATIILQHQKLKPHIPIQGVFYVGLFFLLVIITYILFNIFSKI